MQPEPSSPAVASASSAAQLLRNPASSVVPRPWQFCTDPFAANLEWLRRCSFAAVSPEPDSLWRRLIVAKYYSDDMTNSWPPNIRNFSHRSLWRYIHNLRDLVSSCSTRRIGNGLDTAFWTDPWLACGPIASAFPRLHRLTMHPDLSVAGMWNSNGSAWDLKLRRNLTDLETTEWASLSLLLSPVRLSNSPDSWLWPLESSGRFSIKSLTYSLLGRENSKIKDIYSVIWKDHYPKKIKVFLWELSLGALNTADRLQRRIPYMSLSPSWCCMCHMDSESASHLFVHCSFVRQFWWSTLDAFGWSMPLSNNIFDFLSSVLVGHPFKGTKKLLWLAMVRAFLWNLWIERNGRLFRDISSPFDRIMDKVLYDTFMWCKNVTPFDVFSSSFFISNWRSYL